LHALPNHKFNAYSGMKKRVCSVLNQHLCAKGNKEYVSLYHH